MTVSRQAALAELGIPHWRARPGVSFPGAPVPAADLSVPVQEVVSTEAALPVDEPVAMAPVAAETTAPVPPSVDLCLHADAHGPDQIELLERMAEAVRGLREGLKVATAGLQDQPIRGAVAVRLDGGALPSLEAMASDPSLKRPVWQALKDAVARLP